MPEKPQSDQAPIHLRKRAEKHLGKQSAGLGIDDPRRMLHELEVHQIELEMQNAELRAARDEAETLLDRYTQLYDFAPVGYFTLAATGTIRLVNLSGALMLGIERAKLMRRSFSMLITTSQRPKFRLFLANIFAGNTKQSADFELADKNLEARFVNIEAQRAPDGFECSAIIQDITARKSANEQMRISEIRYRRIFEAAHDGILLVDPATKRIIGANPFMTHLLGFPTGQLIGRELFEIGLLKDESASRKMFRELIKNHEVRYENLPLKSRTGSRQDVEVVANLYQEDGHTVIQCNIRDISIRKLAERTERRNVKLNQEIARRKIIENDLRAHRKEQSRILKQSRQQERQLRDLSHRIIHTQEEERKCISRELHDVIAQRLVGINVHLEVLSQNNPTIPESLRKKISKTQSLVEKSVEIIHHFARQLRPSMLDDLGLVPALQMHMTEFMAGSGIRVSLDACSRINQMSGSVRTALYRTVQEALTNVARHSKATHAAIRIDTHDNHIHMTITDNGVGFHVIDKTRSRKSSRLGLVGMRERIEMIGGTFEVDSMPGSPTTIRIVIPAS
jgi:PAS domain S-box-containing protein